MKPFINALPIGSHTPDEFAFHLKKIISHTARVSLARKLRAKAKREKYSTKRPAKPWNFRINANGTPVITLRGRPDPYLYRCELIMMVEENPHYHALIHQVLAKRNIEIREGKPE